jgi:hypothetical protein
MKSVSCRNRQMARDVDRVVSIDDSCRDAPATSHKHQIYFFPTGSSSCHTGEIAAGQTRLQRAEGAISTFALKAMALHIPCSAARSQNRDWLCRSIIAGHILLISSFVETSRSLTC